MRYFLLIAALIAFGTAAAQPPHAGGPPPHAGPPEPLDEFGRYVKHLGVAQTQTVEFRQGTGCDEVNPLFNCVTLNPAPSFTGFNFDDLAEISLPAGASHSLICFTFTPFHSMEWSNPTGAPAQAHSSFTPRFRITNAALDGLTDAVTGLPFNGVYEGGASTYHENWRLDPGESRSVSMLLSRNCTGGLISAQSLLSRGLSEAQVRDFFANPMTFSFGVGGSFALATGGTLSVGVRLYGD